MLITDDHLVIFLNYDINKMLKRGDKLNRYKIGMYGGKFMPFHKGHNYCIDFACSECDKVFVILFHGGSDELNILKYSRSHYLSVNDRKIHLFNICKKYKNAVPVLIDVSNCKLENGEEDWDAETPLVRNVVGNRLDAVYSSEVSYDEYFKRAYPEAVHRIVDYKRIKYPISGTDIRKMKNIKEREKWIV